MRLPDQTAIHILKTIARAQLKPSTPQAPSLHDAIPALRATFPETASETPTTEADLAKAALDLLSADPNFTDPIRVMASQAESDSAKRYIEPTTIAVTTAVLLVLQTKLKFKVDHTGKWSVEFEKKSTNEATVKLVVERLLAYLDKSSK